MTDPRPFLELNRSGKLLLLESATADAADVASGWADAGFAVRVLRGHKMRDLNALFNEVAAALQFPYYFGENWPAFDECLSDLQWLPRHPGAVLLIMDAQEVLRDAPIELRVLVRALSDATKTYAKPIELGEWWDRPAIPFHIVLQTTSEEARSLESRWRALGGDLDRVGA